MFGYVMIDKKALTEEEVQHYRNYYCGLCSSLKRRYGLKGQITLNFDLTFVAILLSDLYEAEEKEEKFTCFLHPLHKHGRYQNEYIDYCADMTILLAYYKALDDRNDEGRKLPERILRSVFEKMKGRYSAKEAFVREKLEEITRLEKANCQNVDEISGVFGEIMQEVFLYRRDAWEVPLGRCGYYLGKFIYLMDAVMDLEQDKKKGLYNPLKENFDQEAMIAALEDTIALCVQEYERLPIIPNDKILKNVLYSGVWLNYESRYRKEAGE